MEYVLGLQEQARLRTALADHWLDAAVMPVWQKLYTYLVEEVPGLSLEQAAAPPLGHTGVKLEPHQDAGNNSGTRNMASQDRVGTQHGPGLPVSAKLEGQPSLKRERATCPTASGHGDGVIDVDTPPCTPPKKQRNILDADEKVAVVGKARPALAPVPPGTDPSKGEAWKELQLLLDNDGDAEEPWAEQLVPVSKRRRTCQRKGFSLDEQLASATKRYLAEIGVTWQHAQVAHSRPGGRRAGFSVNVC